MDIRRTDEEIHTALTGEDEWKFTPLKDVFADLPFEGERTGGEFTREIAAVLVKTHLQHHFGQDWDFTRIPPAEWLGLDVDEEVEMFEEMESQGWLDHTYRAEHPDGADYFVSEPYHLHTKDFRSIVWFCDTFDLDVYIGQRHPALWFPMRTTAVVFSEDKIRGV